MTYDDWFRLLLLALLYPSMVLASTLILYLLYRTLGWLDQQLLGVGLQALLPNAPTAGTPYTSLLTHHTPELT